MLKVYELNNNIKVTEEQLAHWNKYLNTLESPEDILKWSIISFPHLFQTTAFGLTGLATINMLSKIHGNDNSYPIVPLIFIDTLHHFPQTLDLMKKIETIYYTPNNQTINVFKPTGCTNEIEFANKYGDLFWETDEDKYDFLVKVEPASRAYRVLNATAVLTGRRRSQGSARSDLKFVEIDELNKIIKINPLASWTFEAVKKYIDDNDVPTNELLQLGYKSIGDYHSTQPIKDGEDERSGRWKGKTKTECGIHETSRFAQFLKEQQQQNTA